MHPRWGMQQVTCLLVCRDHLIQRGQLWRYLLQGFPLHNSESTAYHFLQQVMGRVCIHCRASHFCQASYLLLQVLFGKAKRTACREEGAHTLLISSDLANENIVPAYWMWSLLQLLAQCILTAVASRQHQVLAYIKGFMQAGRTCQKAAGSLAPELGIRPCSHCRMHSGAAERCRSGKDGVPQMRHLPSLSKTGRMASHAFANCIV